MTAHFRVHSVERSLKALFTAKKPYRIYEQFPDKYYRVVYVSRNVFEGVKIVADLEHITKKNAVDLLMEAGLSKYMGKKVADYIEAERIARENNQPVQTTRFNTIIRKYAREKGLNIKGIL